MFIGTLSPDDKAFVASVLRAALEDGYQKVVEPCSGGLAMSCIAADVGFRDIEASDVTLFSGILGRYVEGRGIEDMEITRVEDGSRIDDPLDAMMEIKHAELVGKAGSVYGEAMLIDFEERYDEIRSGVKASMDEIRSRIPSLKYRDMDMFDQIASVRDEKCVIVCMCPTYEGGKIHHRPQDEVRRDKSAVGDIREHAWGHVWRMRAEGRLSTTRGTTSRGRAGLRCAARR